MLLNRDKFSQAVQKRDGYKCVVCGRSDVPLDSHHIMERRLFVAPHEAGGYFIDNGVSLCDAPNGEDYSCHLKAEMTLISVEDLREAAGITKIILPEHLEHKEIYTKWGDYVLPNGRRSKGELFTDESVQKILAQGGVLSLYTDYIKYPRTFHLPYSPGVGEDDKVLQDLSVLESAPRVIVTVKLDGENVSMYNTGWHARSVDSRNDISRHWMTNFHSRLAAEIPEGWRVCGENLWAKHSIAYNNLTNYFYGFSIWNDKNICLSWDETLEWFGLLGLTPVPILYDGPYDEKLIKGLYHKDYAGNEMEGFTVRVAGEIRYREFRRCLAKYVRKDHNKTNEAWRSRIIKNRLLGE